MLWIKSGIENPSKSEVIGRCGGDEKNEWPRRTYKSYAKKQKKQSSKNTIHIFLNIYLIFQSKKDGVCV